GRAQSSRSRSALGGGTGGAGAGGRGCPLEQARRALRNRHGQSPRVGHRTPRSLPRAHMCRLAEDLVVLLLAVCRRMTHGRGRCGGRRGGGCGGWRRRGGGGVRGGGGEQGGGRG